MLKMYVSHYNDAAFLQYFNWLCEERFVFMAYNVHVCKSWIQKYELCYTGHQNIFVQYKIIVTHSLYTQFPILSIWTEA